MHVIGLKIYYVSLQDELVDEGNLRKVMIGEEAIRETE